ncbi:hypothetical protein Q8F55_000213 [Vanrija albida]|uniref:Glutathione S-transferase n=1 Tax=Vanrija albida TaxID=181172 RepID=A0ABR3QCP0_9TREE
MSPTPAYTLYHLPGSQSTAPHWLLLTLAPGVTFRTVKVDVHAGEQFDPAFLAVNPKGKIPALVVHDAADLVVTESAAIVYYLASRHAPHLVPSPTAAPAQVAAFHEQFAWFASTLSADIRLWFFAQEEGERAVPGWSSADAHAVRRLARSRLEKDYAYLDTVLAQRAYLTGEGPSVVDFLVVAATSLSEGLLAFARAHPHVAAFLGRMYATPGWKALVEADKFVPAQGDEAWGL